MFREIKWTHTLPCGELLFGGRSNRAGVFARPHDFVLYPLISASGSDERGDFQLVAFTVTSLKGSNCFFQVYNDGFVIRYDVKFQVKTPEKIEANGSFATDSGRSGAAHLIFNFEAQHSNMADMSEASKLIMTYGAGIDHIELSILPQILGSGVDVFSSYSIAEASMALSKHGNANLHKSLQW